MPTEEERAAAYLLERRAMVAARNARLEELAGSTSAAASLRTSWRRLLPPYGRRTADDDLTQRTDAPQEL